MKRQGFTLVELLVVIAIIALLMGILMPALSRVRQLAYRLVCGANLSGIGKTMLVYANDCDGELPRAGGRRSVWGGPVVWNAADRMAAYGTAGGADGHATISSSLYLLVKYSEISPKSFVCKSDTGTTEWELTRTTGYIPGMQLSDAWDFGDEPEKHCSYAYHWPFGAYALTTADAPGLAVAADRNPWQVSPAGEKRDDTTWADFYPNAGRESVQLGNSRTHEEEGQNVLFLDSHVEFAKTSACSLEEDNIYTLWASRTDREKGKRYGSRTGGPQDRKDSLLLHSVPSDR